MFMDDRDLYCETLPTRPRPELGRILVTGASGYIGGRLVPELLARGYRVRVMVRAASPEYEERWPGAEIVIGDALQRESVERALDGIHSAYYLIHSLLLGPAEFESADIQAATTFRTAAGQKQVKRIIYLGGLGDVRTQLSPHLRSRIQVSQELQSGTVPVTILRAAIILGSGSASYEIVKHLIRNVPVLPVPSWARTHCQPISIRDVVRYLVGVLETDATAGQSYDIGGSDVLSYESMLRVFAEILGLKRVFLRSPISNVKLFAYIASLVTPVPHAITACLMESTHNEVVCQNDAIRRAVPFEPLPYREAIVRALSREEQDRVRTRWSDAYPPAHELAIKLRELKSPPRFISTYSLVTEKAARDLFRSFCSIGGKEGWFNNNWMWRLRGWLDRLIAGVGTSRGRRSHSTLRINDVIDFWRVEELKKDSRLLLRAEMKLPGMAWLQFNVDPEAGKNRLSITAFYQTTTLLGRLYWYATLPLHVLIFDGLIKQINKRSQEAHHGAGNR